MTMCEVPKGLRRNSLFASASNDKIPIDMSQNDVVGEVRLVD
jgi:hypothetical protein